MDIAANKKDVIRFGEGIYASDIKVFCNGDDLIFEDNNGNRVTVGSFFAGVDNGGYVINEVQFADGTIWDVNQLMEFVLVNTEGDDRLHGGASDDILNGLGGHDHIIGGAGNDFIIGGAGNDKLMGGKGSDTYYFERGWGQDYIENEDTSIGRKDVIRFGAGIRASDIILTTAHGGDLILSLANSQDTIRINRFFEDLQTKMFMIDEIQFADGTVITKEDIIRKFVLITGTNDHDTLYGTEMNNEIYGLDGNDMIEGGGGNDFIVGGTGNDYLDGGEGSDTYYFERGWGQDEIYDSSSVGYDIIRFAPDIKAQDIEVSRSGYSIKLTLKGATDSIVIASILSPWSELENITGEIQFSDGTSLTFDTIKQSAHQLVTYGTNDQDFIFGCRENEVFDGRAGNDFIWGEGGSDTFIFNKGWGQDRVIEYYSTADDWDKFIFGEGISENQLWFSKGGDWGNALEISLLGTTDKITIDSWFSGKNYQIEEFQLSNGKTLYYNQIDALVSAMAAFAPPAAGQTSLTPQQQAALQPILTASWQ